MAKYSQCSKIGQSLTEWYEKAERSPKQQDLSKRKIQNPVSHKPVYLDGQNFTATGKKTWTQKILKLFTV
jgi:hypothetical protein